jgi:hypothetical protein
MGKTYYSSDLDCSPNLNITTGKVVDNLHNKKKGCSNKVIREVRRLDSNKIGLPLFDS